MAHINLLPWREWERERRKNEFLVRAGGTLVIGALLVVAAGWCARRSRSACAPSMGC